MITRMRPSRPQQACGTHELRAITDLTYLSSFRELRAPSAEQVPAPRTATATLTAVPGGRWPSWIRYLQRR